MMPLYSPPKFVEDEPNRDDRMAALKIALEYLKTEAGRLGLHGVVAALEHAIVVLETTQPPPLSSRVDD